MEFQFDIVPRTGVKHQDADTPSRLETDSTDKKELNNALRTLSDDDEAPNVVLACFNCDHVDANGSGIVIENDAVFLTDEANAELVSDHEFITS